ncbi:MAG TPA: DUF4404 family protein [Steroidobacteraceae bacterium]|nr:DUF4404 family protein [Steroidobacteraceae bacterium]
MNNVQLHAQIEGLRKALQSSTGMDAQTRNALSSLQRDVDKILHAHGDSSLGERFEAMAVRFENDHPAVGRALRQVIDALAKAGM